MADAALDEEGYAEEEQTVDKDEIEKEIEAALACPCVSDLKEGPCGRQFVTSFSCFLRNNYDNGNQLEKCVDAFNDLQECMIQHPEQFADFVESNPQNQQKTTTDTVQKDEVQKQSS